MRCYVLIAIVVVVISVKNSEETDSIVIIHSYDGVPTKEKDFRNDKYKRKIESRKIANHHYYMHRNKPTATTKGDFWKEIENDLVKSSTIQPSLLTKDISTKTSYSHFFMKQPARISKGIFSHSHQPKHTFKRHSDNNGHMKHRFNREKVNRQRLKDLQANLTDSQQSVDSNNDQIDVFDFGNLPKEPLYQSENYSVPRTGPIRTRSTKNHSLEKKYSITDEIFLSAEVDKGGPFKKEKETKKDTENSTHALQLDKRRNNTTVASVQKRPTPSSNRNRYQQVARRRSDSTSEILIQRNDNWLKKTPLEEKHRNTTTTHKYDEVKTTTTPKNLSRRRQLKRPGVSNNQKLIDDFYAKLNSELTPPKEETVQTITPLPNFSVTTHDDNIKFASNEGTSSIVEIVDLQPVDDKNLQHPDPKVLSNTKTPEEDHKLKVHTKPRHIRKKPPNEDTQDVFTTYTYPQGVLTQKHQDKDEEKNNHRHRSRKRKPERKDSTETANPFATKSDGDEEDEIEAFSKKHVVDLHVHRKQKPPPPSTHDDKKTDTEPPRRTKPEENHHRSGYRIRKKKPPVYDMEEPQPTIQSKNDLADFTEQIKHNSHTKKHQLNEVESFVKNYEKELQSVRDKFSKQQNLDKEDEVTTTPRSRVRHKTDKKNGNFEDVAATNYDYGDFKPSQPLPVEFDEKPTPNGDGPKLKEADVDYFINFFKQHQQLQKNETKSVRGRKKQNHHQRGKQLQLEIEGDGGTTPPPPKSPVAETTDGDTNKRRKNHRQRKPQIELDAETRRLNLFKNLKQDFPPKDTNQGQFGVDLFSGLNLEESKLLKALNENLQPLSSAKENGKGGEFPQQHNYDKEALTTNFFSVPNITFFKIDNPLIEATKITGGGGEHFKEVKSHVDKKLNEETDDLKEVYDKLQKATKNVQNFVNGAFPGQLQTSGDFVPVVPNEYLKQTTNGQNKFHRGGNFRQQQKQQLEQSGGDEKQTNDYQQQLDLLNSIQQQNYPQQQIGRPLNNTKPNRLNLKTTVFQNGLKTAQEILDINLFANLPAPPKQITPTPEMINLESTEPKHTRNQPNQKLPEIFSVNLYTTSQENLNNEKTEPNVPLQTNDYNQYGLPTNVQNNQQNGSPIQDPVYQIITKPPVPVKQIVKPTPSTMYTSTRPTDANHRLNQPFNSRDLQDFLYKLNKSSPILIDNFQIVPVPPQTVVQKELQSISKQAEADLYAKLLNIKNTDSVKVLTTPSSKVIVTTEDILKYYMEQPKQKGLDQMQIEELVKTAFPTEKDVGGQDFKYTLMDVGKKTTQPPEIYDLRKPPHNQLTYAQLEQLGIDLIKQNPNSNAFVVDSNGWTPLKTTEKTTTNNNNNVIMPLYNALRQLGNNVKLSDLDLLQTWINENVIKENPPKTKTKKTEVVTKIIPKRNFTVTDTNVGNLPHLIPIDLSKIKITLPDKDQKKDTDLDEHYRKFLNQPYWNNDEVLLRNFLKHEQKDHSIGQRFGPEFAGFYNGEAWNDAIRPVKTVKDYMSKAKPKKSKERKGKVEENSKIDVVIKQKPEESSRRGGFDHVNLESLIRAYPMYTKLTGNTRQGYYVEELPEDTRPSKVFVRNTPRRGYMVEEVLDHR